MHVWSGRYFFFTLLNIHVCKFVLWTTFRWQYILWSWICVIEKNIHLLQICALLSFGLFTKLSGVGKFNFGGFVPQISSSLLVLNPNLMEIWIIDIYVSFRGILYSAFSFLKQNQAYASGYIASLEFRWYIINKI